MLSEAQLAEWERLAQAATPGPWYTVDGVYPVAEGKGPLLERGPVSDIDGEQVYLMPRFRRPEDAWFVVRCRQAVPRLLAEVRRLRALLEPSEEQVERLAEAVHQAWMAEKQRQGFADHPTCFVYAPLSTGAGQPAATSACRICGLGPDRHHPDMLPYKHLPEAIKDYDRATVRAVLRALAARGEGT